MSHNVCLVVIFPVELNTTNPLVLVPELDPTVVYCFLLNLSQIFKFLLLFIYYIFELFFHILVESTNYIQ